MNEGMGDLTKWLAGRILPAAKPVLIGGAALLLIGQQETYKGTSAGHTFLNLGAIMVGAGVVIYVLTN